MKKESVYKKKIAANKAFKEDCFSLSGLQRYAIRCFEKKENPDFLEFCSDLNLTVNDMKFEHVIKYGTERELNRIDRKTGRIIEKKSLFSFWLFITCLARYRKANPMTVPQQIEKVKITEKKKRTHKTTAKKAA